MSRASDHEPHDFISSNTAGITDPRAYSVCVRGDRMLPTLDDGDTIICSPDAVEQHGFEVGAVYAIQLFEGEFTVKRVTCVDGDSITLHADNPRHSDQIVRRDQVQHAARAVSILRDLEEVR